MKSEEARAALDRVDRGQRTTGDRLVGSRPPLAYNLMVVVGYFLLLAGAEFPPAVATGAAVTGFLLIAFGLIIMGVRSRRAVIRGSRGYWTVPRIAVVLVTGIVMLVVALFARQLAFEITTGGLVSVLAAVPSTLILIALMIWLYRGYYSYRARTTSEPS